MDLAAILAVVALLIGIGDLVLILLVRKNAAELVEKIETKEKTVMMNEMFVPFRTTSDNPETIEEGIRSIARVVKDDVVKKYDLKNVATVKELLQEIKRSDIEPELKDELLIFFNRVAYSIYSDDISKETVESIKKTSRDIISNLKEQKME